jgi:hypothetical protein
MDKYLRNSLAVIIVLALMLGAIRCWGAEEWTTKEKNKQGAVTALIAGDVIITDRFFDRAGPSRSHELNPFLPDHPTRTELYLYGAASATGHAIISYVLPRDYRFTLFDERYTIHPRNLWQNFGIGIQTVTLLNSWHVWAGFQF